MVDERKTPDGYKVTEVGVIPEDWEVFKLGDIIDYTKGFAFKSSDYRKSGVRIIRVSDTDYDQIKDADEIYIDKSLSHKFKKWKLTEDDIILSTVGSKPPMYDSMVGKAIKVSLRHEGALLNQNAVKIISKNNKLANQTLIFYNLKTKRYLTNIEKIFRGNANQASITLLDLFKFEIPMPKCDKEQKAIAEALSDTDNLIQSVEKLIDKKKKIKQGVLQQLLTGKKRLPEFEGEWEVRELGNYLKICHGKSQHLVESPSGKYPILATGGQIGWSEKYLYDKPSVLIGRKGTIDKPQYIQEPFWTIDTLFYSEIYNNAEAKYLYYLFNTIDWYSYNEASGVPSLNSRTIEQINVKMPPLDEQKAIAQVLSDMDAEIKALEEKLERVKTIKQGMMQELLTGRIRLI